MSIVVQSAPALPVVSRQWTAAVWTKPNTGWTVSYTADAFTLPVGASRSVQAQKLWNALKWEVLRWDSSIHFRSICSLKINSCHLKNWKRCNFQFKVRVSAFAYFLQSCNFVSLLLSFSVQQCVTIQPCKTHCHRNRGGITIYDYRHSIQIQVKQSFYWHSEWVSLLRLPLYFKCSLLSLSIRQGICQSSQFFSGVTEDTEVRMRKGGGGDEEGGGRMCDGWT